MSNSVRQAHLLPSKWPLQSLPQSHRQAGANAAGVAATLSQDQADSQTFVDRSDPQSWADESDERPTFSSLLPVANG